MSHPCELCRAPKSQRECGECGKHVCKNCLQFLEPGHLAFHPEPPAWAKGTAFCAECYESLVAPELAHYNEVLERSREVTIVRESYRGYLPALRKANAPTEVSGETDRGEATAKLCFLAAWQGYDAVAEFATESKKVRNYGWEKKAWSARGLFLSLDYKKFRPPEESD